jgi:hypothetical protein
MKWLRNTGGAPGCHCGAYHIYRLSMGFDVWYTESGTRKRKQFSALPKAKEFCEQHAKEAALA